MANGGDEADSAMFVQFCCIVVVERPRQPA